MRETAIPWGINGTSGEYDGWWYCLSLVRPLLSDEIGYDAACCSVSVLLTTGGKLTQRWTPALPNPIPAVEDARLLISKIRYNR